MEGSQALGKIALGVLEKQLAESAWLVAEAGGPTIADIACYPYAALAPEGDQPGTLCWRWNLVGPQAQLARVHRFAGGR